MSRPETESSRSVIEYYSLTHTNTVRVGSLYPTRLFSVNPVRCRPRPLPRSVGGLLVYLRFTPRVSFYYSIIIFVVLIHRPLLLSSLLLFKDNVFFGRTRGSELKGKVEDDVLKVGFVRTVNPGLLRSNTPTEHLTF